MDHQTLEEIFVQRRKLAVDTVERIRESVLQGNRHYMLFIGPRGCGKTHFVSLIYHRVKKIDDLRDSLRIAWLNEDKTSTSFFDLQQRIYEALRKEHPVEFPAEPLDSLYDLSADQAARRLSDLLKEHLHGRTALVILENLDALFESLGRKGQHEWRSFLQESGQFAIVATAQQLFPGVSNRNLPFYGFFQTTYFNPLTLEEGHELLTNIAQKHRDADLRAFLELPEGRNRVRALQHLSGGNHRVYVVLSEFIDRKSLDELVGAFEKTLDELTPYYQERLRWLSPQQRMIVEHLCTCGRALPVKDIARALFTSNQAIARQLKELKQKRYVRSATRGRESLYELTEPLMRLAMELKENRGGPVRLIVDFLRVWYSRNELHDRLRTLPDEARIERLHVQTAIEQIDAGAEDLRLRALLMDLDELKERGDTDGLIQALQELDAATDTRGREETVTRLMKELEGQYPSLRLGSPFSAEGIPPQLVFFGSPPMPKPERSPEDKGPPPPAPDQEATADMGYDEEDLRILAIVGDYRYGSLNATVPDELPTLPPHPTTQFEEAQFIKLVRGSISFTIVEKHRFFAAIPRFSQFQIDDQLKILNEECAKFCRLSPKHLWVLRQRERQHARDWCGWLAKMIGSSKPMAWLDAHKEDEINDFVAAAKGSANNKLFSMNDQLHYQLVVTDWYFEHGRTEDAEGWLEGVREFVNPKDADRKDEDQSTRGNLLKELGRCLRKWKHYSEGLEILNEAGNLLPHDASIWSERGYVLSKLRRNEEAHHAHEEAVRLDTDNLARRIDRAAALCELDRFDEALAECDSIIEAKRDSVSAWEWKAITLRRMKRHDEAVTAIDEAIKLADQRSELWLRRGFILDDAGRNEEAVAAYSQGIKVNPQDAGCFNDRAVALYQLARYEEAMESVTESLRLRPDDPSTRYTRAEILLSSGQWEKGWHELQECLRKFPPQKVGVENIDPSYLIRIVIRSTQEPTMWRSRVQKLVNLYAEADALTYLGESLVRCLKTLAEGMLSHDALDAWRNIWHDAGDQHPQLSFALRLLDVGIEYVKSKDPKSLFDLPIEQRSVLQQLFDIEVAEDD